MSGMQIGIMKSQHLHGFYVPPIPFAHLVANGWTPPPAPSETHDPTEGLFLCPEGTQ